MEKSKIYNLVMGPSDLACVVEALSDKGTSRAQALLNKIADYLDAMDDGRQYVWEVELCGDDEFKTVEIKR